MPKLAPRKQSNPHDRFIKGLAQYREVLRDLPKLLPTNLAKNLAPESIRIEPGSYIDEQLAHVASDVLFSCNFKNKPGFLYFLFEHQTTAVRDMPFRVVEYTVRILKEWRRKHPRAKLFPAVLPVVFHQSNRPWNFPTRQLDLFNLPPGQRRELEPILLSGSFYLVELRTLATDNIKGGLLLKLALGLMKAVASGQQTDWLRINAAQLEQLLSLDNGLSALRLLLHYFYQTEPRANKPSTLRDIAHKVSHRTIRSEIMTLAEALHEEGRQEGRQQGLLIGQIQIVQKLLGRAQQSVDELADLAPGELRRQLKSLEKQLPKVTPGRNRR